MENKRKEKQDCAVNSRPELSACMKEEIFRKYYYLKKELTDFCRMQGLPASGGKAELTDRIAYYLRTGKILSASKNKRKKSDTEMVMTLSAQIEPNFICTERHRAFFKQHIDGFSFNVPFQKWLKCNAGKTYAQAIEAYHEIMEEKKNQRSVIDGQFEYNIYIRDFFAANPQKTLQAAITCWKYKKSLPGQHRYEQDDLTALE